MRLTLEQIDLICRMCASYTELELVTSAEGGLSDGGIVGACSGASGSGP